MLPTRGFLQRGNKIAPLAVFQHRVAQIAGGDEPRGQLRDFAFLLFNDFVENVAFLKAKMQRRRMRKDRIAARRILCFFIRILR